jgi:hypothetical protein
MQHVTCMGLLHRRTRLHLSEFLQPGDEGKRDRIEMRPASFATANENSSPTRSADRNDRSRNVS